MGNYKLTAKARSIPVGLLMGIGTALGITAVGAGVTAWSILGGVFSEGASGYCAMVILLLSAAAGAAVTAGTIQRLRSQMCLAAGGGYYLCLLLITALFFGGQYAGMGVTALMVLCGCMVVILMTPGAKSKTGRRRRKRR